jgi:hypothetical protein
VFILKQEMGKAGRWIRPFLLLASSETLVAGVAVGPTMSSLLGDLSQGSGGSTTTKWVARARDPGAALETGQAHVGRGTSDRRNVSEERELSFCIPSLLHCICLAALPRLLEVISQRHSGCGSAYLLLPFSIGVSFSMIPILGCIYLPLNHVTSALFHS